MKRILCFSFALIAALAVARAQPLVNFIYPTNGQTVPAPVELQVNFTFVIGRPGITLPLPHVVSVEYFANGESIGISSNAPILIPGPVTPLATEAPTRQSGAFWPPPSRIFPGHPLPPPIIIGPIPITIYWPFSLEWNPPSGNYTLTALATDDLGNTGMSDPENVTVIQQSEVTVVAGKQVASPGSPGFFIISRTGDTNTDLPVSIYLGGNARNGVDYARLPTNSVTIPAGASDVSVEVDALKVSAGITKVVSLSLLYLPTVNPIGSFPVSITNYQPVSPDFATVYLEPNRNHRMPAVRLLRPTTGQSFVQGTNIFIYASTMDSGAYVTTVDFFDGTKLIGEKTNPIRTMGVPLAFPFIWTNPPIGSHLLRVRATDSLGAAQFSPSARIFVRPAQTPGGLLRGK